MKIVHVVGGGCHCRNIEIEVSLSEAPEHIDPRACDCSFCRKHGASFVSDPQVSLRVKLRDPALRSDYRQGSGQAEFLLCRRCGVLVGAFLRLGGRLYATVNTGALEGVSFRRERPVSPQTLSAQQKAQRWQELWFCQVSWEEGGDQP